MKQLPADNAYEALTRIPGVSDTDGGIKFSGNEVTLIINGQATTLTQEQLADRLKAMPAAQLAKAEVMLAAPARYHIRGNQRAIQTQSQPCWQAKAIVLHLDRLSHYMFRRLRLQR